MPCADFSTCLDDELTSSSIVGLVLKNTGMPVMSIAQCNLSPLSVLRDPDTCHDMFVLIQQTVFWNSGHQVPPTEENRW